MSVTSHEDRKSQAIREFDFSSSKRPIDAGILAYVSCLGWSLGATNR